MMAIELSGIGEMRYLMALLVFLLVILAFASVIIVYLTLEHRRLRDALECYDERCRDKANMANRYAIECRETAKAYRELRGTYDELYDAYKTAYAILQKHDLLPDETEGDPQ